MYHLNLMVLLIIASFVLLGAGFNYREEKWGIALLGLGVLSMLSTLFYKLQITFG